jgi:hypothetical protein
LSVRTLHFDLLGALALQNSQPNPNDQLSLAMDHIQSAIGVLDSLDAPAQIAAYLDLAIHQIDDFRQRQSADRIETNADPQ